MKIYNSYLGREFDTEEIKNKFGTVELEREKLYLIQQPYIDQNNDNTVYHATAIDTQDNVYEIEWDVKNDFDPRVDNDESDACDWNKYTATKL